MKDYQITTLAEVAENAAAEFYIGIKDSVEFSSNARVCWRCKGSTYSCPCPVNDYNLAAGEKN